MKRLFVSLYAAALLTFVVALAFTWVVLFELSAERDAALALDTLRGGLLTVADDVRDVAPDLRQRVVDEHATHFEFPLVLQSTTGLALDYDHYGMAGLSSDEQFTAYARIDDTTALVYGPMDVFSAAVAWEFLVALSLPIVLLLVLILAALRPLVRQTRAMAGAAEALSLGRWDTRIDQAKAPVTPVLASAFNAMAQRVQDSLGAQQHLLEAASHELRTPLSKVRFAVELLASAETAADQQRWLARAQSGCDRLDDVVDELLDHVRVADTTTHETVALAELVALVHAVADELDNDGTDVPIDIQQAWSEPVGGRLGVGTRSLKRVVRNLIDNARYWGVKQALVTLSLDGESVTLSVEDDGPGIAAADRDRVLEPFETNRGADGGLGLGLALVARIARQTAATLDLDRSPRLGGCRVRLRWHVSR